MKIAFWTTIVPLSILAMFHVYMMWTGLKKTVREYERLVLTEGISRKPGSMWEFGYREKLKKVYGAFFVFGFGILCGVSFIGGLLYLMFVAFVGVR